CNFFFSSRRRHTRFSRDWSSDVCSSDLIKHHNKVAVALNENCAISLPEDVLEVLAKPHRLSYYFFHYIESGAATYKTDLQEFTLDRKSTRLNSSHVETSYAGFCSTNKNT